MARSNRAAKRHNKHDKNDNTVVDLNNYRKSEVQIIPRNRSQEDYLVALYDDNLPIVVGTGPAGTGKTLMATKVAIKGFNEGKYKKIVITRPNIAVDDKDIGFLPGDIISKMSPWMMPILDVFLEHYSQKEINHFLEEKIVEIIPVAFLRGRTFKDCIVLVDEAQGTTDTSMKAVLTRIGDNSKMIVTGDLEQSDRGMNNGLNTLMKKILEHEPEGIKLIKFQNKDIERHKIISTVLKLYD